MFRCSLTSCATLPNTLKNNEKLLIFRCICIKFRNSTQIIEVCLRYSLLLGGTGVS
jgi:hypothetical protein